MAVNAPELDWWARVGKLWEKATGGADVAARPDVADSFWPTVAAAPGVSEAAEWFREGLTTAENPRMLFLVGGPGAGKSHAMRQIIGDLSQIGNHDDGLAHRSYDYRAGAFDLRVINDATISAGGSDHALADDVTGALRERRHLVACVNRGVLVEESNRITEASSPGQALVLRLTGSFGSDLHGVELGGAASDFIVSGSLREGDGPIAEVVVVYVDHCSLFERRPQVSIEHREGERPQVDAQAYVIRKLTHRDGLDEADLPAGALLKEIVEALEDDDDEIDCNPIRANLLSLSHEGVRSSVLAVLRSSEIVTGARMTFREVWGVFARAVVADLTLGLRADQMREFLGRCQPDSDDPIARWEALRSLAGLRISQGIFGASEGTSVGSDPVLVYTGAVDPVRDCRPGNFEARIAESGWGTPVLDAFSGLVTAASPLDTLLRSMPATSPIHQMVTDFDRQLDASFTAATGSDHLADKPRAEAIAWYGDFLTRMFALAHGIPAFRNEVAMWTLAWAISPGIPADLEGNLRTLLRPRRDPDDPGSSVLLPLFASRTTPIVGSTEIPRLAIRGADVELRTSRIGDRLTLHMREEAKAVGNIELDFAIVREALTCGHGHVGITNLSSIASPRLERFRAARLVPARLSTSQLRVVLGDREAVVGLEDMQ